MNFDQERHAKAARGAAEHRPNGGAWRGDAAVELRQEFLDMANYADRLYFDEGRIDEATWRELMARAQDGWVMCWTIPDLDEVNYPHREEEGLTSCGSL